jgi:general secretion pathway protein L
MNGKLRLDEFLTWWTQQMLDLIPPRVRRTGTVLSDALVVTLPTAAPGDVTPHEAEFSLRRRGRESSIGHFALDETGLRAVSRMLRGRRKPACIVLRPPPSALLERGVSLPLAAARDPGGVLRYELERLTPFMAEEVFWAWRLEFRDISRRLLQLRLSLLPKAGLLAPIEALRRAGFAPIRLEPLAPNGQPRAMGLGEPDGAALPRREAWHRRGLAMLWVLCGGLAAAAVALPFVIQSLGLYAAERHIEALRPQVAEAEGLRKRIAEAKGSQDAVTAERARVGDALQVIAAQTELLPDDTYLTDLTLRQRKLTIAGRSAAAARLIGLLSADPTIRDAAFIAPITRATSGPGDMFSIRAELGM